MHLDQAMAIADRVKARLAPHCDRIEIAGSIRRRKADVGDIEIVAIPKTEQSVDLLGETVARRSHGFAVAVCGCGRPMKGDPRTSKYIQFATRSCHGPVITVDLFTASAANWGLIFAIRTGSAAFSHRVLACGWVRHGFRSADGMLWRDGVVVQVPEERDLFRLAGVPWFEPEERDLA